ncbi:hypothetical protein ACOMHN_034599 [Nucella lapillus]
MQMRLNYNGVDSFGQKKTWRHRLHWQRGGKHAANVYYVKGSSIPVECLELNCNDSRLYYQPRRHKTSTSSGNPSLMFLMNWQIIPPLSRLAVLQRAVHCRHRSLLPVIREASGSEGGGDSRQRGGRNTTSRQSRGLSSGDDEDDRPASPVEVRPSIRASPASARRVQSPGPVVASRSRSTLHCWPTTHNQG